MTSGSSDYLTVILGTQHFLVRHTILRFYGEGFTAMQEGLIREEVRERRSRVIQVVHIL